ncbi:hypothetical protein [Aeromonas taiwanensis]|uniref:hypothetical protein n=1 Tax=Aeromonas taiwanensis TaxID=633417 RepID=UPI003F74934F
MKRPYQDPADAVGAIAAVLEAAQLLSCDPKTNNLVWGLIAWAQETAQHAADHQRGTKA